jgi:hypothetical protein
LELWLKGKAPEPDKLQLHRAFRHIERLELDARTGLEVTLLLAIQENFDWRLAPLDEAESIEFTPPFNSTADGAILILCEEFGWFDNDRRISELLFWEPEKLADQLRNLRDFGRISGGWVTSPPSESRWKWFNGKYWFIIFIALQSLRLCSHHETRRVPPPTDSRLELQSLIRS